MRLLLLLLLLAPVTAWAETVYRGEQTLWQDTVWEGEILIDGILTVAPEVRLEIRPGSVIRFTRNDTNGDGIGEHELFVQGELLALGTAEAPIRFTAAGDGFPGFWGAINMMASENDNRLEHCLVEFAYRGFHAHFGRGKVRDSVFRHNRRAFQFQESTVSIERCRIVDNFNGIQFRDSTVRMVESTVRGGNWGVRCVYSDIELVNNLIEGNLANGVSLRDSDLVARGNTITRNRRGLYLQRSRGEIDGNWLQGNAEHGTFFEESDINLVGNRIAGNGRAGIRWIESGGTIVGNDLSDNGEYAVINDGSDEMSIGRNWWGKSSRVAGLVRDQSDRADVGPVRWDAPLPQEPDLPQPPIPKKDRE
ncbi:MAG: hypothetical protein C0616_06835 [Desulfuromonas sp.]|nr:MAG: hypothetical protein C0616_06835 [Desulfuromonas sp.]